MRYIKEYYDYDSFGYFCAEEKSQNYFVGSKTQKFPHIHYTNDYYRKAKTLYGKKDDNLELAEHKKLFYVYDDRLQQNDWESWKRAIEKIGRLESAENWEQFLCEYYRKKVEVIHVLGGFNLSNGYNYFCIGFKET